ncbi:hypothetical protein GCM10027093_54840 [Paraburkholderia jirisanensis]
MQDIQNIRFEEDGVALISPCYLFEWSMEFDDGSEILDFYRRGREVLADRLTHYDTGDGRWKPLNKRAETLVPTWCENPIPFPKKFYCFLANGAGAGATASSMRIDLAHRPYKEPDAAMLKQWKLSDQRSLPAHTVLRLTLPLDHPLVKDGGVAEWLYNFDIVAKCRFISGTCALGLNFPLNFPTPDLDSETHRRVAALLQRHPGLDVAGLSLGIGTSLWRRDPEFIERHQAAKARPYLKRANWLTFLSEDQVDWIGGMAAIEDRLKGSDVQIRKFKHGICLQAGAAPQLGDTSRADYVPAYLPVARLVRPVRIDTIAGGLLPFDFREHGAQQWLDAFEHANTGDA